jgi:hypothetical protein
MASNGRPDNQIGHVPERAPAKTGKGFGDRYDGRANTNAGSPGTQVHQRENTPRIIRWAKSTP